MNNQSIQPKSLICYNPYKCVLTTISYITHSVVIITTYLYKICTWAPLYGEFLTLAGCYSRVLDPVQTRYSKVILDIMENDIGTSRELTKKQLAAKNLGLLVYTSIWRGDSYSSYEDRVLMLKKMGVFVGTSNHSAVSSPQFDTACHKILTSSIVSY